MEVFAGRLGAQMRSRHRQTLGALNKRTTSTTTTKKTHKLFVANDNAKCACKESRPANYLCLTRISRVHVHLCVFFKLYFGYLVGTGRDGANLWQIDLMSGLGRAVVCVLQFCTTSKLNAARKRDVVIFLWLNLF